MSDVSRACFRCRGLAVVTRGNAAFCMKCNETMDWSEVIAMVQGAEEPLGLAAIDEATVVAAIAADDAVAEATTEMTPAVTAGHADPFAQKLS